ncbi:MAG: glycosyltransferase [Chthonomonadaceae bacterium]|nr:glycosyltransferase [Chthonomonadaceae bacterium]
MPRVSVIVPSYNHGRFLTQCLTSVQDQEFQDWEVVLIDDGSQDDSLAVAQGFAESDPRFKVSQNVANLGAYATQAKALESCSGEFVAILNSDDYWEAKKLNLQTEALSRRPECPVCYCLGWTVDTGGVTDLTNDVHGAWPVTPVQDLLPYLVFENRILASSVLVRREALQYDTSLRYSGDWWLMLRLAQLGPVACVPDRLTFWRLHESNSYLISPDQVVEEVRFRRAVQTAGREFPDTPGVRDGLMQNYINLVSLLVLCGDMAGARAVSAESLNVLGDRPGSSEIRRRALKRLWSSYLPKWWIQNHLWGRSGVDVSLFDRPSVRQSLADSRPLCLRT